MPILIFMSCFVKYNVRLKTKYEVPVLLDNNIVCSNYAIRHVSSFDKKKINEQFAHFNELKHSLDIVAGV